MSSVAFVMPAHGRHAISILSMTSLARTIGRLQAGGIEAGAFVVTDEPELLEVAADLGFGRVEQENAPLGRKFNDGYQAATDPEIIDRPFDYVVPIGSDDWIDPEILLELRDAGELPEDDEIICFRRGTIVAETGRTAGVVKITYPGGLGIRVIPRALLVPTGYRPVAEDRMRAIDASTLQELRNAQRAFDRAGPMLRYRDFHPAQIVDWKSSRTQLNPFKSIAPYLEGEPFSIDRIVGALSLVYGADHVEGMLLQYAGAPA